MERLRMEIMKKQQNRKLSGWIYFLYYGYMISNRTHVKRSPVITSSWAAAKMIISKNELSCDIRTAVYLSELGFDILRARHAGYITKDISTGTLVIHETTSPDTEWDNVAKSISEFLTYYRKRQVIVTIRENKNGQQILLLDMLNN